jgi:hypothetical protein
MQGPPNQRVSISAHLAFDGMKGAEIYRSRNDFSPERFLTRAKDTPCKQPAEKAKRNH